MGENINPANEIAGYYIDANFVDHGFTRNGGGRFITFEAPGAGTGAGQGTVPISNDSVNGITGYFTDSNGAAHGFLRTP